MKNLLKGLVSSLGATTLAALIFGGSPAGATTVENPPSAVFQQPTKRLVLDYGQSVLAKGVHQTLQHESHSSHASHASHASHYSSS
jgi:hypothetical protein